MTTEENPLISVITPAYNAEDFIKETIRSVIDQTYANWEMIIVDDRSQDNTVPYIKEMQAGDDRIKLVELEENSGSAIARNTAMDQAEGRYIAFLDSDDGWLPGKLERQLQFMAEKDIAFSFTTYVRVLEDGTPTGYYSKTPATVNYDDLMKRCVIGCLTVMLDRDKIDDVKMADIRTRQDYALWLKLTRWGHLAYGLPEVLATYRVVGDSISSNKGRAAKQNWYVFRHMEKQNLAMSMWYFAHYAVIAVKDLIKYRIILKSMPGKKSSGR